MRIIKEIIKKIILKYKWKGKAIFCKGTKIGFHSSFEGMNKIYPNTYFNGSLGLGSYISNDCEITGRIGRFCSIAPHVRMNNGRHPYTYPYATTSPAFFSEMKQNSDTFSDSTYYEELVYIDKENRTPVIIENDCWIGEGVFITGGVKIGNGAVVLARSVVTKDIPPYAIVGGIPAKVLKYRYTTEDIEFLLKTKWWNNSKEWFRNNWRLLHNIDSLKSYYANSHIN